MGAITRRMDPGLVMLAGSVVLLSSAWPVTKLAVDGGVAALWFAAGRAGFSGLTALLVLSVLGRLRVPGRADLPTVFGVGLLQLAGFFAFAHAAVAFVPAGRTAILANVTTVWIVPLSILVLREPISRARWLACGLGVAGTVVLMGPWAIDWRNRDVLLGHVFLLAASLSFAGAMVVVRRWPPRQAMVTLLPWCFGLASLVLVPLALLHGGGVGRWDGVSVGAMAYIGLFAGPMGTWCVMEASVRLPAVVASVGFLMTPAVGLVLASLLLGEKLTADLLWGAGLITAGVVCTALPARRPA